MKRALVPVLFAAVTVLWYAPSSLSPASAVPDAGDTLHIAYILAWDAHQIVRDPFALYESNSFFPYPHSLAFSEQLLPEALLVAPIQWLTGNAILAANASAMLGLFLSALAMWLLIREWTGSTAAGVIAGLIFAFNTFTRAEAPRLHLLHMQWWPLALLMLTRYARDRRPRQAWAFAAFLLLQGLSCTYYLVFSAALTPVWLAGAYLWRRRRPSAGEWITLAAAGAVAAAIATVILLPLIHNIRAMGFEKAWTSGVDLMAYVWPASGHALWGFLGGTGRVGVTPQFLGFAGIVMMIAGVVAGTMSRAFRPLAWAATATATIGAVMSFGHGLLVGGNLVLEPAPYGWLHNHVPLMRGMASPERFTVLVRLGGAILGGLAAAAILARVRTSARPVVTGALGLLLVAEHWMSAPPAVRVPTGADVPSVYRWLAQDGTEPIVELPVYPDRIKRLRAAYLYFSTFHWRPLPLGRTSFYPPNHDFLAWNLRDFPDHDSIELLKRLGIRTLVIHPRLWSEPRRGEHLRVLDEDPRLRLVRRFEDTPAGAAPELGLGEERVYRIADTSAAAGDPCEPADELRREGWSFTHSGRKLPALVRDGNRRTAWFTHQPQRPGDFFQILLDAPRPIAAVAIDMAYPYEEFPRNLILEATVDGRTWQPWSFAHGLDERWQTLQELINTPRQARFIVRPTPQEVRGLRLSIANRGWEDAWPQWSIPELRLYAACRPATARSRVVGSGPDRQPDDPAPARRFAPTRQR